LAIIHVTVINTNGSAPQPDSTVVIDGSRISAVGAFSSTTIPAGARIIEASGKFLIPGLTDMHLHLTGAGEPAGSREFILPLLVANGVTTVRDMGGIVASLKQLRHEIDSGERLGPQIFFTGPYLDGNPPSFQPSIVVQDAAEARNAVQRLKFEGVDFIKVQSRLQPEAYFAIAQEAQKGGMRFVGHVPDSITARQASDAGQASIEHLTGVLLGCSTREEELRQRRLTGIPRGENFMQSLERGRVWDRDLLASYSSERAARLFQKFAANHTWQVPTLPLLIDLVYLTPESNRPNDPRMKYIPSGLLQFWELGRRQSFADQTEADFRVRRKLVKNSLATVKEMYAAGVPIMAGTDATAPNVIPGFSLHEDLDYLVQAGLAPMQALQAATSKPAEFLGLSSQQGTIAAGKRADLVLLDANPLDDIRNTQTIRAVILKGKLLNRSDLDALLAEAERFASTH